jgi:hypothetical protein
MSINEIINNNFRFSNVSNDSFNENEVSVLDTYLNINNDREDIDNLINMGYELKTIKKLYVFLKPHNLDEALNYLNEIDGKIQHFYLPYYKDKKPNCVICGEPENKHIENPKHEINQLYNKFIVDKTLRIKNKNRKSNLSNNNNKEEDEKKIPLNPIHEESNDSFTNSNYSNTKNDDNNIILNTDNNKSNEIKDNNIANENIKNTEIEVTCILCEEILNNEELFENELTCKHYFCNECYMQYLYEKITSNNILKIPCMQNKCPTILNDNFIHSKIKSDQNLLNKYERFKKKEEILENPNLKFCPFPGCDGYAELKNNDKYVTCVNGHKFCFKCLKNWHGKKKCDDQLVKDFKAWKKNKTIKQCPKCKMWTEKNRGCNHMTCAECKYQWCWLCRGKYTENHFEIGGCTGLQFNENECFQNCFALHLYKFIIFVLYAIGFIILGPAIFIFNLLKKGFEDLDEYGSSAECKAFLLSFFLVIAFQLFFMQICVLVCVPCIFYNPLLGIILKFFFDLFEIDWILQ